MGFPAWTLWGMGLSAVGALLAISLAFLAQSPRLLARLNLTGQRLDLRARSLTGYGLALLILAMGFFLAGVPLGTTADDLTAQSGTPAAAAITGSNEFAVDDSAIAVDTRASEFPSEEGSSTGAMAGLPTSEPDSISGAMDDLTTPLPELAASDGLTETVASELPPNDDSETGPATAPATSPTAAPPDATATLFPTATPSPTPIPTLTPTPIFDPTAIINDQTSTLPLRATPGGEVLVVLLRGDTVILRAGRAFHSGQVWQEVVSVAGVAGWLPDRFLDYPEESE